MSGEMALPGYNFGVSTLYWYLVIPGSPAGYAPAQVSLQYLGPNLAPLEPQDSRTQAYPGRKSTQVPRVPGYDPIQHEVSEPAPASEDSELENFALVPGYPGTPGTGYRCTSPATR
eukprot:1448105-Rhodomonas_salina.1